MKFIYSIILLKLLTICASFSHFPINDIKYNYYEEECVCKTRSEENIKSVINSISDDIERVRTEQMIPGIVAGISLKDKTVWTEAFGKTDIENDVKTHRDSVWRMASISKSLTTALVGKLMEKGLIDLEKSIHTYLKPEIFPIKQWKGKNVTITIKQVMSHTAGLRVSKLPDDAEKVFDFKNVTHTISQFKNDELLHEPGTAFNYSNYGFQIIGAIIESVLNETYESAINNMFKEFGMSSTFAERHEMIIPHRAHYYMKSNSPYNENWKPGMKLELLNTLIIDDLVSLEAQWPCGGIVSTVDDLLKFGNYMLNSYKGVNDSKAGYLKQSTIQKLWTPVTALLTNDTRYAQGWTVTEFAKPLVCSGDCKSFPINKMVWHSGGMVGLSTLLSIFPDQELVIVLLNNLKNDKDSVLALKIAQYFAY